MYKKTLTVVVFMLLYAARGMAQAHQHAKGEILGEVRFATSCNDLAQSDFNRAVALLHSFQFSRAIDGFNATLQQDPACAIAYWGISLSDWSNPFAPGQKPAAQLQLGMKSAKQGQKLGAKTPRERAYLMAVDKRYADYESTSQMVRLLAYRDAMESVSENFPGDNEAQIFYALALAVAADPDDKTYADQLKAGAILEKLFARQPTHPGLAHYIIHAYDVPALADRALAAAQRYAEIAPDAPHALHMPSHTFTRLGYWQESIDSNVAAAVAARRQGQTAEELHASDYETYAYLQTGQDKAAARIVAALPNMASRFDPKALLIGAGPPAAGYFALAAIPARYALERRDWQGAESLPLSETPFAFVEAITWFARGLGAGQLGHAEAANQATRALKLIRERLLQAHERYWAKQVEIQATAVSASVALAAGNNDEALQQMKLAADMEDETEKNVVTPGPLAPARELLGEMLLDMHKPTEALVQFEATLKKEPRRFRSLYEAARAAQLSGRGDLGRKYFRELLAICVHSDNPGRSEIQEARNALAKHHRRLALLRSGR
jgi:predicted NBD/HSP70 family sugar kinase